MQSLHLQTKINGDVEAQDSLYCANTRASTHSDTLSPPITLLPVEKERWMGKVYGHPVVEQPKGHNNLTLWI